MYPYNAHNNRMNWIDDRMLHFITNNLTEQERKRFCEEKKIFKQLIDEYELNMNRLPWRMNPYTDQTFKIWNNKLVQMCHRWNVSFDLIKVFFTAYAKRCPITINVPMGNMDDFETKQEFIQNICKHNQFDILNMLFHEYENIIKMRIFFATGLKNDFYSIRHFDTAKFLRKVDIIFMDVWGVEKIFARVICSSIF